jgi:hypothetical protein
MSTFLAFAQPAPSTPPSAGLDLIQRVVQRYADAKSYSIETVEERTSTRQYSHSWDKTILTAAEAPGGRSYYEGLSSFGSAIQVTDGKTVWKCRLDEHRYTAKAQVSQNTAQPGPIGMSDTTLMTAMALRKGLADLAKPLKSAERLPDETLTVNGQKILCQVVRSPAISSRKPSGSMPGTTRF